MTQPQKSLEKVYLFEVTVPGEGSRIQEIEAPDEKVALLKFTVNLARWFMTISGTTVKELGEKSKDAQPRG